MGKLKLEKEKQASELSDMISRASFVVFTDFKGLNVAEVTELRVKLRKAKVEYHVVKNTLLKRSINNSDIEQYLNSPTAIALSYQDPIIPAKIIKEFSDAHENLKIKAGILGNKIISQADVKYLAQLVSKEQLIVQLLVQMKSPIVRLVNTLSGSIRKLIYVIEAIKKVKGSK